MFSNVSFKFKGRVSSLHVSYICLWHLIIFSFVFRPVKAHTGEISMNSMTQIYCRIKGYCFICF